MFRASVLAVALLIPFTLLNAQAERGPGGMAQPCSDFDKSFPPCGIPKADKKKAKTLYEEGLKLAKHQHFEEALQKLKAALAISPLDTVYKTVEQGVGEKVAANYLNKGNQALQSGDKAAAVAAFRQAVEINPANEYAEQRLQDALPPPEEFASAMLRAGMGETRLQPKPGAQDFEFRGQSNAALDKFARMFGISAIDDQGLTSRSVRVKLDGVDWQTGSQILQRVCKVLIIPLTDHQVMIANDTEDNRRDLTSMTLRTYYAQGGTTPAELTELTTALRVMFDLRFITPNAAQNSVVIRAPQAIVDAVTLFLDDLQDDRPTVMLEVKIFEVSTAFTNDLGVSVPNQFTAFNIPSEINSLVTGSTYSQIVAALAASGQSVNASTILAALLASSSSTASGGTANPLSQPFAVFGGGKTLTGVAVPETSLNFSFTGSRVRTVQDVLLRAGHAKAATLKVGERYPIVSSQFSATSSASSLLAAIGLGSTASSAVVPTPQFTYEDIGLVLKATPQVHGDLVVLDYELTVRALGTTQSNGLPLLTNREMKGTISTGNGQQMVIAGLLDKEETLAINGIPGVAAIPVLGTALSTQTKEKTFDELLVVMRPMVTSGRNTHGIYLPIPTNLPK
jgi:type II secretory pathway component GspD/PulD (secretin)